MAYDPRLAQVLREDLAGNVVSEQKMFGGLAFLIAGHMVCGVHRGGAMFRVGKEHYTAALAIPDVHPMTVTGKPMVSMVACGAAAFDDETRRGQLLAMALATVRALPPKMAKPAKG